MKHAYREDLKADEASNPLLSVEALLNQPRQSWTIKGMVPEVGVGMIYGPSNVGKTFFVLSMLLGVSYGHETFQRKTKQGCTFMVPAEGLYGVRDRVEAWIQHHGEAAKLAKMWSFPGVLPILDPDRVESFIKWAKACAGNEPIRMVVLDTLNRCLEGSEENSAGEMSKAVAACARISNALQCMTWIVHHEGKNGSSGPRGSSVLFASCDTVFRLKAANQGVEVLVEKQKDGPNEIGVTVQTTPISLGNDEDGEEIIVPVASLSEATAAASTSSQTAPADTRTESLRKILATAGRNGLSAKEWYSLAKTSGLLGNNPSRDFKKSVKSLLDRGLIKDEHERMVAT